MGNSNEAEKTEEKTGLKLGKCSSCKPERSEDKLERREGTGKF